MPEFDFIGKAGMASRFSGNEDDEEWRIRIYDNLDNADYSMFQIDLTVGTRWNRHEYISFGFDHEDVINNPERRKQLDKLILEFDYFKQVVEEAHAKFEAAYKKVLDGLPEAE